VGGSTPVSTVKIPVMGLRISASCPVSRVVNDNILYLFIIPPGIVIPYNLFFLWAAQSFSRLSSWSDENIQNFIWI
jgi:hypothetical protein